MGIRQETEKRMHSVYILRVKGYPKATIVVSNEDYDEGMDMLIARYPGKDITSEFSILRTF